MDRRHLKIQRVEARRPDEVTVDARRTGDPRRRPRRSERDGREIAAVRAPDLPGARDARAITTVVLLDACVPFEVHVAELGPRRRPVKGLLSPTSIGVTG